MIDVLVGYAEEIGVPDIDQFRTDLEEDAYAEKVLADYDAAIGAGLTGTPAFVVRSYFGARNKEKCARYSIAGAKNSNGIVDQIKSLFYR